MKTGFAEPEIVTRTGPAVSATMPSEDCEALLGRSDAIGSDGRVGTVNRGGSGRSPRSCLASGRSGRTGPQPGNLCSSQSMGSAAPGCP